MKERLVEEIQKVLEEENDPKLSCLEARHLVERNLGYTHDGLLRHKATFIEAFQSCEASVASLSPGERASWLVSLSCSGALYLSRYGWPSGLFSWVGAAILVYMASALAQQVYGSLAAFYLVRIRRLPFSATDPSLGPLASLPRISVQDQVYAHLFPLSSEARGVHRRRWLHASATCPARSACALDHLVYICADLEEGIRRIERLTGVRAAHGGSHPGLGTHNALLSLGDECYLEIIAPDPSQPTPAQPRPFGLDERLDGVEKGGGLLVAYAVHPTRGVTIELVAASLALEGLDPGRIRSMSRRKPSGATLQWQLTSLDVAAGPRPWVIDWGATTHPARTSPTGCRLVELRCHGLTEPTAHVERALGAVGLQPLGPGGSGARIDFCGEDVFSSADERQLHQRGFLLATLETPNNGRVTFGDEYRIPNTRIRYSYSFGDDRW